MFSEFVTLFLQHVFACKLIMVYQVRQAAWRPARTRTRSRCNQWSINVPVPSRDAFSTWPKWCNGGFIRRDDTWRNRARQDGRLCLQPGRSETRLLLCCLDLELNCHYSPGSDYHTAHGELLVTPSASHGRSHGEAAERSPRREMYVTACAARSLGAATDNFSLSASPYIAPLLEKDCAVCKEQFQLGTEDPDEQVVVTLPCKHPFHEPCIMPWLKSSGTCPVCR